MTQPTAFLTALAEYCRQLQSTFASGIPGQPEDQLKSPVQRLVNTVGTLVHKKIISKTESPLLEVEGRPDIAIEVDGLLCGYVELKAPDKGANPERFRGADKRQWEKFKSIPNLIYTDASDWALYREGVRVAFVRANGSVPRDGVNALQEDAASQLKDLLQAFLSWEPIVPQSPQALAAVLAPLCRLLRHDVEIAIKAPDSNLSQLAAEWRLYLFPDADDAQFADAYAQTLTYALLLARVSGDTTLNIASAADQIQSRHALLAQALRVLGQPDARSELDLGINLLERCIQAIDVGRLAPQQSELWLYFYEEFLSAYDPKLRRDRGVYYTPVEVVRAQVSIIENMLASRFRKELSFADDSVFFLDPGVGTGTYPLAAIKDGLDRVRIRYGAGSVPARASAIANNLHAFEILVGPYAVAHLRLTNSIQSAGGVIPESGLKVFLADTLESPNTLAPDQKNLFFRRLSEEHLKAQQVKSQTKILVCMGNPPYDRQEIDSETQTQERKGGWVRFGDSGDDGILNDFLAPLREANATVHAKNLYNDYVYFWRWALWKVFETTAGTGIVSFISASSYLRGPGFIGMRKLMRRLLDELWIIDLEGGSLGPRPTENVFNIKTPVAIAVGVRYGSPNPNEPAIVSYAKLTGSRSEKLEQLGKITKLDDLTWEPCYRGWADPFLPERKSNFYDWPLLVDLLPWVHSGVQFKRSWPIAETRNLLLRRWSTLLSQPSDARGEYLKETGDRTVSGRYSEILNPNLTLPAIDLLPSDATPLEPIRYGFRSFDRQWALPDNRLCDRPRPPLWYSYGDHQVFMVSLLTDVLGEGPSATVTHYPPDLHYFRGSFGGANVVPLWRDANGRVPNIVAGLVNELGAEFHTVVSPEDVFAYVYAILATPLYGVSFTEELNEPGPRVPITKDGKLFFEVTELGAKLISLHTYGERYEGSRHDNATGKCRCIAGVDEAPGTYPESFSYDANSRTLHISNGSFGPISVSAWEFSVSGLSVLQSWLRYRMKGGFGRTSSPLDKLRPLQWSAELTEELLRTIWIIESTLDLYPELNEKLVLVLGSETWKHHELPTPNEEERTPPKFGEQLNLHI